MNNTKDLAMRGEAQHSQLIPAHSTPLAVVAPAYSFEQMLQMADAIAKSQLFGMKTQDQAFVLMAICQSQGKDPMQAATEYDIIQGRPAMKTSAILATFQAKGGRVRWDETSDDTRVTGTFFHELGGELTVTWDLERAKKAQLLGKPGPWQQYPQQMMRARCISEAVRAILPGVLNGIYSEEEVRDMPPRKDVTPAPIPAAQMTRPVIASSAQQTVNTQPKEDLAEVEKAKAAFVTAADRIGLPFANAKERGEWANRSLGRVPDSRAGISIADWYQAASNIEETFNIANQANFGNDNYTPPVAPVVEPVAVPPAKTEVENDDLKDPFAE